MKVTIGKIEFGARRDSCRRNTVRNKHPDYQDGIKPSNTLPIFCQSPIPPRRAIDTPILPAEGMGRQIHLLLPENVGDWNIEHARLRTTI